MPFGFCWSDRKALTINLSFSSMIHGKLPQSFVNLKHIWTITFSYYFHWRLKWLISIRLINMMHCCKKFFQTLVRGTCPKKGFVNNDLYEQQSYSIHDSRWTPCTNQNCARISHNEVDVYSRSCHLYPWMFNILQKYLIIQSTITFWVWIISNHLRIWRNWLRHVEFILLNITKRISIVKIKY